MIDKKDIELLYTEINNQVSKGKLKQALHELSVMMEGIHVAELTMQYENLDQTYRMLLEYTFRGVPDPQRDKIFRSLKVSILELSDLVQQKALSNTGMHIYSLKAQLEKEKEFAKDEAARKIDTLHFEKELARLFNDTGTLNDDSNEYHPHLTPGLFQLIWLTDKYVETDSRLLSVINESDVLDWHEKCLAVSALTLSLLSCFDKEKFMLLFEFYDRKESQVWQRALTGIIVAAYYYGPRIGLYPSIVNKFNEYEGNTDFYIHVRILMIQILKAKETEKLTTKFKEEILPDVQKFESRIREKLDLDNLLTNDLIEDKNPDWEKIFEDSPDLLSKIEKMSEMQMDGLDLFMGTFAMLKNFDFFREILNWFRPFYKENKSANDAINNLYEQKDVFLAGMEESFYMCNSDKYSFCFNISHLPEEQARNVMNLFNMEAENLHELNEESKILHKPERETYIFTQYIQDLYRFYKLHPFRNDFKDIFNFEWDITRSQVFSFLDSAPEVQKSIGQFLFEKEHYELAINLFSHVSEGNDLDQEILEKLAYSYQMLGNYSKALENFRKAEIFETNRLWSIKKIIYCNRKLKDIDEALYWCTEALKIAPEDVYLHTMSGNCYLDKKLFEQALDHYFRVEFLAPENRKVIRPISWCLFVQNKLEMARDYMSRILEGDPMSHDYINAGHLELCLNNKPRAIEYYVQALKSSEISLNKFSEVLEFDREYLVSNGVDPIEIQFVIDYMQYV